MLRKAIWLSRSKRAATIWNRCLLCQAAAVVRVIPHSKPMVNTRLKSYFFTDQRKSLAWTKKRRRRLKFGQPDTLWRQKHRFRTKSDDYPISLRTSETTQKTITDKKSTSEKMLTIAPNQRLSFSCIAVALLYCWHERTSVFFTYVDCWGFWTWPYVKKLHT